MRDILIFAIVISGCLAALRRPWIGVMLWTWLSLISPHRYAYGFALDAPVNLMAALCTLVGLLATKDKHSPWIGAPAMWFALFTIWLSISWLAGPDPSKEYEQWIKIMKINGMVLVTLALLRTQFQINIFVLVCAFSLALLGAKGGIFTLMTGGSYRVWGPPGTFVGGNNEFALALVMTIPLLQYLQQQMKSKVQRILMLAMMALCAFAALGSHSRGALLAILAMVSMLWWRGSRNRLAGAVVIVALGALMYGFMPAEWFSRMDTIGTYEQDRSALGRLTAWSLAWNAAFKNIFGLGLNAAVSEYFMMYSSYGLEFGTPVAHSIYFQVLGHHGFIGLFLFLAIWVSTWRMAASIRRDAANIPQAAWCIDLAGAAQVSLIGYLVGGAFLSLAYYDMPYNVMALTLITRYWLSHQRWLKEPAPVPLGWGMWKERAAVK